MANSRVQRGRQTQAMVAEWLRSHGYPDAEPVPAFLSGKDIIGTPGLSIEVKATSDVPILGGVRQAVQNADLGDLPLVVWRPNGYGPNRIDEWIVATQLQHLPTILKGLTS